MKRFTTGPGTRATKTVCAELAALFAKDPAERSRLSWTLFFFCCFPFGQANSPNLGFRGLRHRGGWLAGLDAGI